MLLKDYLADLQAAIRDITQTGSILSSNVSVDIRTDQIGIIKGEIEFLDGSTLFFKEYLDLRYRLDKKMYSFHYQDVQAMLRFRYDNAAHRPALEFQDHKHTPDDIRSAEVPDLQHIVEEIINTYFTE